MSEPYVDPIVEEIRKHREEFAAAHDFDVKRMVKALQERERASGREYVSLERSPQATPSKS